MPRPTLAVLAALSLSGLAVAAAAIAQGIPGLPVVIDDGRTSQPAPAAPQARGQLLDRIVAIVNEGIVTESQLDEAISSYIKEQQQRGSKPPPPDRIRAPMLDLLITRELQLQRAERAQIPLSDEDMLRALGQIAENAKPTGLKLEDLPEAMKAEGLDFDEFRDNLRKEILISRLEDHEVRQRINVTPRELEQHIERLKKLPNENDEYDVSDILISIPSEPTRAQLDELQKKAQDIHERTATEDFASLALHFSNARTATEGGKLGPRLGGELPTDLAEIIVKLKPGEVSKPFLTSSGYHIVKLDGVVRADGDPMQEQVRLRHILLKTSDLEDDATVRQRLVGLRQRILNGEDFAAFASTLSADTGSKVDGGVIDWRSPDDFDPAFAEVAKGLKDNEISPPFQSQYGWHIVQMLGHQKVDTTEENLRERAFVQLRNGKAEEEIELWRRQMRDEAFIKILEPQT